VVRASYLGLFDSGGEENSATYRNAAFERYTDAVQASLNRKLDAN
jgi:hypothetical protein